MSDSTTPKRRARKNVKKTPEAEPQELFVDGEQKVAPDSDSQSESKPEPASEVTSTGPNPDDLNSLWAPVPLVQTRSQMMAIRAGTRPPKDKFIRLLRFETAEDGNVNGYVNCRPVYLFEYTFDGDLTAKSYYVRPGTEVANVLADKERLVEALLVLGMVRHGSPFIWELKIPNGRNESADKWARSRMEIANIAQDKWLKPVANMGGGGYDYVEPIAQYDEPNWSEVNFDKAVEVACRDRIVSDMEHDAVKEALGL